MKFLKILLGIIIALVIIFFAGGLFLPKTYSLTRSAVINAPDSVVYSNVADFNNFLKWNPWKKMDPAAKVVITGPPGQTGQLYTWDGEETGKGQMLITDAQPLQSVKHQLKFIEPMAGVADNQFTFEPAEGGTKVLWAMSGENKSTTDKWMGLCMGMMMGGQFEDGLKDLKALSEK